MIERLVLFGASGDLSGRYLLPALASLGAKQGFPAGFELIGAAHTDWDDAAFADHAKEQLEQHAPELSTASRDQLLSRISYVRADAADPDDVAAALGSDGRPLAAYLALPPSTYPAAVKTLTDTDLPTGSRVALEKPFGEDLSSAAELNDLLARRLEEEAVFRVDHVLGMATTQNLVNLRFANAVMGPLWDGEHIERIELLWEETIALEGRAGYYDKPGALRDVMQNHLTQLLCLVAMEPPASTEPRVFHERKAEVLKAVRPLDALGVRERTRRARYTSGLLSDEGGAVGRRVPSYVEEEGVEPARDTETFAEVELTIDTERWAGTRFVLRAGKALARRRKGVVLCFRTAGGASIERRASTDALEIGIDGPTDIRMQLNGSTSAEPAAKSLVLASEPITGMLPAYANVLADLLGGGSRLSVSGEEAESAWRIFTPVLEAWAEGSVPLEEYPAGSDGL